MDSSDADTDRPLGALQLDATEARVLGCLVEKEALTPDTYPMTVNGLVTAANQKTSRDPVMSLEPGEIGNALRRLDRRGLVKQHFASRADRWAHRFAEAYGVTAAQQALLALLLLRGPQTRNELLSRSERMHRFNGADDVQHALERLADREPALAVQLPRVSGQREERWASLLTGPVDVEALAAAAPRAERAAGGLAERIEHLEARVAALEQTLAARGEG